VRNGQAAVTASTEADLSPAMLEVLQQGVGRWLRRPGSITGITASPLLEASTFPIERLSVTTDSGEVMSVILKWVVLGGRRGHGREVHVYERLLCDGRFDAPVLYGSGYEEARGAYFLLLEDVGGSHLYGDLDVWDAAISVLADLHAAYAGREDELRKLGFLHPHDERFYRALAARGRANLEAAGGADAVAEFDSLMGPFGGLVAYLIRQPRTLVHGDVLRHNMMVQPGPRVRPIDWDSAAIGLAELDVARLIDGWGLDCELFLANYRCRRAHAGAPVDAERFGRTFACCEVVCALMVGGWSTAQRLDPDFPGDFLDKLRSAWGRVV
jgi:hypothetical protein